jgi:hypothetical protein
MSLLDLLRSSSRGKGKGRGENEDALAVLQVWMRDAMAAERERRKKDEEAEAKAEAEAEAGAGAVAAAGPASAPAPESTTAASIDEVQCGPPSLPPPTHHESFWLNLPSRRAEAARAAADEATFWRLLHSFSSVPASASASLPTSSSSSAGAGAAAQSKAAVEQARRLFVEISSRGGGAAAIDLLVDRVAAAPALALALTALAGSPVGSLSAPHLGLLLHALCPLGREMGQEGEGRRGGAADHESALSFSSASVSASASLNQGQGQGQGGEGGPRVELAVKLLPLVVDEPAALLLLDALLSPLEAAVLRCRVGQAEVPALTSAAAAFNSSPH